MLTVHRGGAGYQSLGGGGAKYVTWTYLYEEKLQSYGVIVKVGGGQSPLLPPCLAFPGTYVYVAKIFCRLIYQFFFGRNTYYIISYYGYAEY